jgi:hypothetical protein
MSSGKGISDAVRGAIGEWMTDTTVGHLYTEYKNGLPKGAFASSEQGFKRQIRSASDWVRITRRRHAKGGWVREYYSKNFSSRNVKLEVISDEADQYIQYVTVLVNGKMLGGGKVRVPSMLVSQSGRKAGLELDLAFVPFSEEELAQLQAQMEYGEESVHAFIFLERVV